MRAYRMTKWQTVPELKNVPIPKPIAGEVRIQVAGNGICQSDLHLINDWSGSPEHLDVQMPMTIGHEIGGWIDLPGPGVTGWEKGQACLITLTGCGHCIDCAQGWNNYCQQKPQQPGIGLDGGLADYVIARETALVRLDKLDPAEAAPLTDAGLSSFHAVNRVAAHTGPGSIVAVIGIGGLGHLAVAALNATTAAYIIAIDSNAGARKLALDCGADIALAPQDNALPKHEADAVLDFVGAGDTITSAARMIRPRGHIVVVGRGAGSFPFTHSALSHGAIISTTFGGSKAELMSLIALAENGSIRPQITRYPLSDVAHAFGLLSKGKVRGRAVIIP